MKFSTYAGTAIMPLLARLVLCAAFVSAGWNKCFRQADFTQSQYERLQEMGVSAWLAPPVAAEITVRAGSAGRVSLASFRQEGDPNQADEAATAPTPVTAAPPPGRAQRPIDPPADDEELATIDDPTPPVAKPPVSPSSGVDGEVYRSRAVHHVTLMVDGQGWPYPVLMGWAAGLTELIGGALLLVGLFSRIWGLGLAITMGVAFYMTSLDAVMAGTVFDLSSGDGIQAFNGMYLQLGLLVLALGVFLTGPGPLSLDHRIFRRSGGSSIEYDPSLASEQVSQRAF